MDNNRFHQLASSIADILRAKNTDYGDSFAKTRDRFGTAAFHIRLFDKTNRLEVLDGLANDSDRLTKDESSLDTLKDIIGYSILELDYRLQQLAISYTTEEITEELASTLMKNGYVQQPIEYCPKSGAKCNNFLVVGNAVAPTYFCNIAKQSIVKVVACPIKTHLEEVVMQKETQPILCSGNDGSAHTICSDDTQENDAQNA